MKDALLAAFIAQIVVMGSIIWSADIVVNRRHTVYAAIFGMVP